MAEGSTLQRLQRIIGEVCAISPASVTSAARLRGYGLDSVRIMELILVLESEFKVQFKVEEMGEIATVGQLAEHIDQLVSRSTSGREWTGDLRNSG